MERSDHYDSPQPVFAQCYGGNPVVLTATVTDQNGSVGKGSVNFCDASASYCSDVAALGSAQLTSAGVAAVSLRLGVGTYKIKAVFLGTNSDARSASPIQGLTVAGQAVTTTTLAVTSPVDNFALMATVTGGGHTALSGAVTFSDITQNALLATATLGNQSAALAFQQASGYTLAASRLGTALVCDINNDGKPDLVITTDYGQISVLLGNGDGTFQVLPGFFAGNNVSNALIMVADFNGDGRLDLAVTGGNNGGIYVLLGNGDETLQASQNYDTTYQAAGVAVGDFNGDGIPDLVTANGFSNTISMLLGNGVGSFQPPQTYSTGNHPAGVVVGDFNGDGNADIAVNNLYDTKTNISILLGKGDGTFHQPRALSAKYGIAKMAAADFRRVGKLDIVLTDFASECYVMLGNGDGSFQSPQSCGVGSIGYDLVV